MVSPLSAFLPKKMLERGCQDTLVWVRVTDDRRDQWERAGAGGAASTAWKVRGAWTGSRTCWFLAAWPWVPTPLFVLFPLTSTSRASVPLPSRAFHLRLCLNFLLLLLFIYIPFL